MGGDVLLFAVIIHIKYQTKYVYSLLELSRMIAEMILERVSLVDLLSFNQYNVARVRDPVSQLSLF